MLRKLSFAVILSDKWVVKNKVKILLHYFILRNQQGHISIILNCEFFFQNHLIASVLKSPLNYFEDDSFAIFHHTTLYY